ncbi:MAG: hypothetical protein ABJP70_00515 [Erythrobacter sp.]
MNTDNLCNIDPLALSGARSLAHRAAQHLTALARANLPAQPDDSHSNLGWDANRGALVTHEMSGKQMGLVLEKMVLFFKDSSGPSTELELNGQTDSQASHWTDETAKALGLKPASDATIPYDFPEDVAAIDSYQLDGMDQHFAALAEWFGVSAAALETTKNSLEHFNPGPSPVRCWPHHFDIATYAALEVGDPETARGLGIGMAPGDGAYDEPYFYVNPWPHLDKEALGQAVVPGHWHTDGFVGLIATGQEITQAGQPEKVIGDFLGGSVAEALKAQGIG